MRFIATMCFVTVVLATASLNTSPVFTITGKGGHSATCLVSKPS
uniref:Uncharacterized protein n=1 Tax=Anguilla anguilla TaxID=7936 RepID=A0A0E9VAK1_ANGAN